MEDKQNVRGWTIKWRSWVFSSSWSQQTNQNYWKGFITSFKRTVLDKLPTIRAFIAQHYPQKLFFWNANLALQMNKTKTKVNMVAKLITSYLD